MPFFFEGKPGNGTPLLNSHIYRAVPWRCASEYFPCERGGRLVLSSLLFRLRSASLGNIQDVVTLHHFRKFKNVYITICLLKSLYSSAKKKVAEDSRMNVAREAVPRESLVDSLGLAPQTCSWKGLVLLACFPKLLWSFPARLKCVCLTRPPRWWLPIPFVYLFLLCFVKFCHL